MSLLLTLGLASLFTEVARLTGLSSEETIYLRATSDDSRVSLSDAVRNEAVAAEVVATLIGSIGLIAAVPVTTGIAALLAMRSAASSLPALHLHAHQRARPNGRTRRS